MTLCVLNVAMRGAGVSDFGLSPKNNIGFLTPFLVEGKGGKYLETERNLKRNGNGGKYLEKETIFFSRRRRKRTRNNLVHRRERERKKNNVTMDGQTHTRNYENRARSQNFEI